MVAGEQEEGSDPLHPLETLLRNSTASGCKHISDGRLSVRCGEESSGEKDVQAFCFRRYKETECLTVATF